MQEIYVFYAAISALLAGFYSFSFKVIAERNYNTHLSYIYMYFTGLVVAVIGFLLSGGSLGSISDYFLNLVLAFIMVVLYNYSIHTRVESMRNMDAMLFYPLYKTFGPIIVICISYVIFDESLDFKEWLGIICGISIPLLLITKSENRIQKNLYRGCVFMLATSVLTALAGTVQKFSVNLDINIHIFIAGTMFFGLLFSLYGYFKKANNNKNYSEKGIVFFSIIIGLFFIGSAYSFMKALDGNFAIATTINSFSILIPIILSIIFYGEHFNFKKGVVILLSIISILLFI